MKIPDEYVSLLRENNESLEVLNAEKLAAELAGIARPAESAYMLGNGGAVACTLLARYGFCPRYSFIEVRRNYEMRTGCKRPAITYDIRAPMDRSYSRTVVDDIVASGGTVSALVEYSGAGEADVLALLLSGKTRGEFRCKDGSTVKGVKNIVTAQIVDWESGMPAILSFRFLLEKAKKNMEYVNYISKYTGGDVQRIYDILGKVDTQPFEMLFRDPCEFFQKFGGRR